jgi:hypothetical protein
LKKFIIALVVVLVAVPVLISLSAMDGMITTHEEGDCITFTLYKGVDSLTTLLNPIACWKLKHTPVDSFQICKPLIPDYQVIRDWMAEAVAMPSEKFNQEYFYAYADYRQGKYLEQRRGVL